MGKKINIVRPDGTLIQGTEEELSQLQLLGNYRAETFDELVERTTEEQNQADYSTVGQGLQAALEGVGSAATFGLSDLGADEEERARAKYSSEARLAGEIGGAIGLALLPTTPVGAVTKLATGAGKMVGGGVGGAIVTGAIEGAGAGLQQTISTASLNNDPLTTQSILSGVGYGSLFGGMLGGTFNLLGKGATSIGRKLEPTTELEIVDRTTKIPAVYEEGSSILDRSRYTPPPAPRKVSREIRDTISPIHEDSFKSLGSTIREFSVNGSRLGEDLVAQLNRAEAAFKTAASASTDAADLLPIFKKIQAEGTDLANQAFFVGLAGKEIGVMKTAGRLAKDAIDAGDFAKASEQLKRYTNSISKVASITGSKFDAPLIPGVIDTSPLQAAVNSAKRAVETQAAARTLDAFPSSPAAFARMSPNTAEKMFAAIDNVLKDPTDELMPLRQALQAGVDDLITKSGIITEGSVTEQLQNLYRYSKVTPSQDIITTIEESFKGPGKRFGKTPTVLSATEETLGEVGKKKNRTGFVDDLGQHFAAKFTGGAAGYSLAGPVGGAVGYYGTRAVLHGSEGLSQLKNSVQNRLSNAAKATGKVLQSRAATYTASKLEPLYLRIDGSRDNSKNKPIEERAKDRITEIMEVAPAAKDIIYRAFEPLLGSHPDLVTSLHATAVAGFNMFLDMIPKDPGMAISGGKSLWKPNPVQTVTFSRMYEAFMTPLHVIEEMLTDFSKIDPVRIGTIKNVYPDLYQFVRGTVLENINFSDMPYRTQAKMAILLDIDPHSSFSAMNIAESQRIFMETPAPPESAGNRGGTPGNAGGGNEPRTPAQSLS